MGKCTERDQRRRLRALPCFSCRQPCTSLLFIQQAVHFAQFLTAGRALAVHFAGILAAPRIRAVYFPAFHTASRALRPISCRGAILCKESGEVHVKKPARGLFRRALPPFSCSQACASPDSLRQDAPPPRASPVSLQLAASLSCTSPYSLQPHESAPCTSRESLQPP